MNTYRSAKITLWISRVITAVLIAMVFFLPMILRYYTQLWTLRQIDVIAIIIAYLLCLGLILPAMWNIDKLLRNILERRVFIRENIQRIRRVRGCCAGVGLICFPGGHFFFPLYFLAVIMLFLSFIVTVVKDVMAAAVEIREENDLTV